MSPITYIHTPFPQKFGVPRQSLLVPEAWGEMRFPKDEFFLEAFRGIDQSTHLWLIFQFHQISEDDSSKKGVIRPPRFKNKVKMGVYATRSPHRPNRLGLSVVKFEKLQIMRREIVLKVSGVDLVDSTPILDIKPYVPYADAIDAQSPFEVPSPFLKVTWQCEKVRESDLIEKVIALDPRPPQSQSMEKEYGISIAGYNIRFRYLLDEFQIISAVRAE